MTTKYFIRLLPAFVALAWFTERVSYYWNTDPDLSFGWIVLMLSGYILWETFEHRRWALNQWGVLTFLGFGFGMCFLFLFQIYTAAMGVMPAAIWAFAFGYCMVVVSNLWSTVRGVVFYRLAFAFLFPLIAMPLPSIVDRLVVGGLQGVVATWVVETLNIIGVPAAKEGSLVRLPGGVVGVDEACSGIRSLQSAIMATLFIGYLTLRRVFARGVLFTVGCGLAIFGNLLRALFLSLSAAKHGIESVDEVHDAAGWGILAFTVVGVALAAFIIQRLENKLRVLQEQSADE